ncbi:MAG: ABC transporter substrate-binding protein [Planctomycetota bacterium]
MSSIDDSTRTSFRDDAPWAAWRARRLRAPLALALVTCLVGLPGTRGLAQPDVRGLRDELRVGISARPGPHSILTPLVYWGGFVTKTAVYDGLTRPAADGSIEPGLAASWEIGDGGRRIVLHVREGVVDHAGHALVAQDVVDHLERWRGNPGSRWIGSTERMTEIRALDPRTVEVRLREPWPFLEECAAAINPAYVVPPGAYDNEGTFVATVGTGPFRLLEHRPGKDGDTFVLEAHTACWRGAPHVGRLVLQALPSSPTWSQDALAAIRAGELDMVVDGSSPRWDRSLLPRLLDDPDLEVHVGPGSATTCLVLNTASGPCANRALRLRLAASIDRAQLVADVERGLARPATTLFAAPGAGWAPIEAPPSWPSSAPDEVVTLRLLLASPGDVRSRQLGEALGRQLEPHGFRVVLQAASDASEARRRLGDGAFDILLRDTYGVPYDPWVTLQAWFLKRPEGRTASSSPPVWDDATLRDLILAAYTAPTAEERTQGLGRVQARIRSEAAVVPLLVPQQVIVSRAGLASVHADTNAYDLDLASVRVLADPPTRGRPVTARPLEVAATPPGADPRKAAVPLPCADDWDAWLVHDNAGVGVWTVGSFQVFGHLGAHEIVGLDDAGRMHVSWSYSGKWTPIDVVNDGEWLGGLAHDDLDPRVPGTELYTAGKRGHLFQVTTPTNERMLDARRIGGIEGREIHTLVAGDLDAAHPGHELLLFTNPGGLYMATPTGPDGTFEIRRLEELVGLVRQALLLPTLPGDDARIATVGRDGALSLLTVHDGKAQWEHVARASAGRGRVALQPGAAPLGPWVLYTTLDDGRVERHEQMARGGPWATELIYAGPAGPRGVVAGRFDADPAIETVAVFGYSHKLQLLTRSPRGTWSVRTIFRDIDKGHWLCVAEVEGRNDTDEIVASGYGGRVVLLARPPGYGRHDVALDPEGDR